MKKLIVLSLGAVLILSGCLKTGKQNTVSVISLEDAKVKAADFINNSLISDGQITDTAVVEEAGLYKVSFKLPDGREFSSYMTKDGKTFFPEALDIAEVESQAQVQKQTDDSNSAPAAAADVSKSDKPMVELFIMSHCPYGTQIEKGIIPAVEALGNKIDFDLKFCGYTMHGAKEQKEQLNQYCIKQKYPDKLLAYIKCFLNDENSSEACMKEVGIDSSTIADCAAGADKEYNITGNTAGGSYPSFNIYKSDNDKYGVKGSPTLVINGTTVSSARDSASLLKAICSAFNTEPSECSQTLSSAAPAPGFGSGTTSGSTDGGCGN